MKRTYLIGDVQGCYDACMRLLETIQPNTEDRILFLGDVINRGNKSLKMIDFIVSHNHSMVLGNHDFHLLACYFGIRKPTSKDTFDEILHSKNIETYIDFLARCPSVIYEDNAYFVHAGIPSILSHKEIMFLNEQISSHLQHDCKEFITQMYAQNEIEYHTSLPLINKLRFAINAFMRMRYVHHNNALDFTHKCDIIQTPNGFKPWFYDNIHLKNNAIYFGHWSTLKSASMSNLYPLDGGYIWGGSLKALRLDDKKHYSIK